MKKCPYCESDTNAFEPLNETIDYSGIEMSLNRQGMLRVRTYFLMTDGRIFDSQDVINIKFCPMCGRKFKI